MGMTLQDILIFMWCQILVDGRSEVLLSGRRSPIGFTRGKQLRTVVFPYGQRLFFGIEQSPRTSSRSATLAREGKRVMQFSCRSQ